MKTKQLLASLSVAALLAAPAQADRTPPAARKPTTLTVDTQKSTIEWFGKKVFVDDYSHKGTINLSKGTLTVDGGKLTGGVIEADMTSIKDTDLTDAGKNARLVGHLKSDDFFGVEKYPTATFKITKATPKGGNQYELTGDLTLKGKTSPVTFPATVTMNGTTVTAVAKVPVDRSKYDVKFGSKSFFADLVGDKVIADEFELTVNLVASK
jgi:polyisoprenoid-binding protein YceI